MSALPINDFRIRVWNLDDPTKNALIEDVARALYQSDHDTDELDLERAWDPDDFDAVAGALNKHLGIRPL